MRLMVFVFLSLLNHHVANAKEVTQCTTVLSATESGANATPNDQTLNLKQFANRFRSRSAGVLVTPYLGKGAFEARQLKAYVESVLWRIGKNAIDEAQLHVVVSIYSGLTSNAFATSSDNTSVQRRYLGVADDGKPIFEIGFLQGMLGLLNSEDQLAFILGHELGHILLGHVDPKTRTAHDSLTHWASAQHREVEADLKALEFMLGHYNLESALSIMEGLLSGVSKEIRSTRHFLSSHHHPSVRLAILLARLQQLRRTDLRAAPQAERTLLGSPAKRSPRSNAVTQNSENYREQFHKWFRGLMAERNEKISLSSIRHQDPAFSELNNRTMMRDVTNDLFREALLYIRSLPFSAPEKLERVFELLLLYSEDLWVSDGTSSSISAVRALGSDEIQMLSQAFRMHAFNQNEKWNAKQLLKTFDDRNALQGFAGATRIASEFIYELARKTQFKDLFEKLAQVSSEWRNLIHPLSVIPSTLAIPELKARLSQAMKSEFSSEDLANLVKDLNDYSLDGKMETPEGLRHAQALFKLKADLADVKNKDALVQALQKWFSREETAFKNALLRRLDTLLAIDLGALDAQGQIQTAMAMSGLFDHPNSKGLTEDDLANYAAHLQDWIEKAYQQIQKGARAYIHMVSEVASPLIANHLISSPDRELANLRFFEMLDNLGIEKAAPFLKSRTNEELQALINRLDLELLRDKDLVQELADFTGLSVEEIYQNGLQPYLIDYILRKGVTPDQLKERLKNNPQVYERLKSAIETARRARNRFNIVMGSREIRERLVKHWGVDDLQRVVFYKTRLAQNLRTLDLLKYPHMIPRGPDRNMALSFQGQAETVLQALLRLQNEGISFERWHQIYRSFWIGETVPVEVLPLTLRDQLSQFVTHHLKELPRKDRPQYVRSYYILQLLSVDDAAEFLADDFIDHTQNDSLLAKSQHYLAFRQELSLPSDFPDLDILLKRKLAQRLNLQPGQLDAFYPKDQQTEVHGEWLRGISGLVAEVQRRTAQEQIEAIEYITGRSDHIPAWIKEAADKVRKEVDATTQFENLIALARMRMARATPLERTLALLPFFTGENSMVSQPGALDFLIGHIVDAISPKKRSFALRMAKDVLRAEGRSHALALAMIFSLKTEPGKRLSEGEIVRALCSYGYGVPGVKLAQYLAFTSDFRELLGELQDQAIPLDYFEAISLLEKHFPNGLPDDLQVVGIKGSGSVNLGIDIFNSSTRRHEILSVPRDEIEIATQDDFRRLKKALIEITRDAEGAAQFGFTVGLLDTIQASVELEFDRPAVFEKYQKLSRILNRTVQGWHVQMVEPYELLQKRFIRMQMAPGIPARLMEKQDPNTYKSAMQAASKVLTDHLLRSHPSDEYFADLDFHDGQAFIDPQTKSVWLIDPGQAVLISQDQYEAAILILKTLGRLMSVDNALEAFNQSMLNPHPGNSFYTREEIAQLSMTRDKTDAFIRFISLTAHKGGVIPLPVVQWVLGMNRQLALSQRIGSHLHRDLWLMFAKHSATEFKKQPSLTELKNLTALMKTFFFH